MRLLRYARNLAHLYHSLRRTRLGAVRKRVGNFPLEKRTPGQGRTGRSFLRCRSPGAVGETASRENRSHCGHGYLLWYSMWQCFPKFQHRCGRFRSQNRDALKTQGKAGRTSTSLVVHPFPRACLGALPLTPQRRPCAPLPWRCRPAAAGAAHAPLRRTP